MRLAIDLDGVVADFNAGWIRRYNEDFGTEVPSDAVTQWSGLHELTHFPDMGAFWRWAHGGAGSSIFRHLEPYEDAVETLERLSKTHEVVIVTQKPGWAIHDTFAWLADNRIPTREVHIISEKWRVPADLYLDDAPHQIRSIHRARPEAAMCRMVRPWNDPVPGVFDVESWPAFADLVGELAGRRAI